MYDLDFLYDYELIEKNTRNYYFALPFTADTETSYYREHKKNTKAHPATAFLCDKNIKLKMTTKVNCENYSNIVYLLDKFKITIDKHGTPINKIYKQLVADYDFIDVAGEDNQLKAIYNFLCHEHTKKHGYIEELHGWVYQWAFCFDAANEVAYSGRTVRQLATLIKDLSDFCKKYGESLTEKKLQSYYKGKSSKYNPSNPSKTAIENSTTKVNAIVFIHNLGFDLTYIYQPLKQMFKNEFVEFYREPQKPLYIRCGAVELRDSAVYFNEKLENVTTKYHVAHPKKVGFVDYDKCIFPDDDVLTEKDWIYQFNDVFGLQEGILADFKAYGYNICTAPKTNTGRVRQACRIAYKQDPTARKYFTNCYTDGFTQTLLNCAFAGGYVHGNRHYKDKIIKPGKTERGMHDDLRSGYPSEECNINNLYQSGQFEPIYRPTLKHFINNKPTIAVGIVWFKNIRLKNPNFGFPYISTARAKKGRTAPKIKYRSDNGRLLFCEGEFDLVVTDVDLEIILKMYTYDKFKIKLCMVAPAAPLPRWFRDFVDDYFRQKTELKKEVLALRAAGADKDLLFDAENDLEKIKNMFNSIAGMTETNPCKAEIKRNKDGDFVDDAVDIDQKINAYYGYFRGFFAKSSKGFLPYSWGVWTVAYCRKKLFSKIFLTCPYDEKSRSKGKALYCDTDSLFYLENRAIKKALKEDNDRNYNAAIKGGYYITDKEGNIVNYDSFDHEDSFSAFKFLHSKCYCYEKLKKDGSTELKAVIAGVAARALVGLDDAGQPLYIYKEEELGSIDNFNDRFTFKLCGVPNTLFIREEFKMRKIKGHLVECGDACIIYHQDKVIKNTKDVTLEEEAEELRRVVDYDRKK